jgi:tetratricopeptide (TPR) repeat protein
MTPSLESMLARALRLQREGKLDQAGRAYRDIISSNERHAECLHLLAMVEFERGNLETAEQMIRKAIAIEPDHPFFHGNLGTIVQSRGRIEEAVTCHRRAIELKPDYVDAHNNLGIALVAQRKIEEAIAHYGRALDLNPNHANAHANLGIALMEQNRAAEAITHYRRALELNPNHANAHNNLGIALAAQGQLEEAIAHYRRSIELNPANPNAHNNLAIALADLDKIQEALEHYARALELAPDHAETRNNLGNAFKSQGRFDLAREQYARAAALRPDYTESLYNLSEIHKFRAGDPQLAALQSLASDKTLPESKSVYVHFALAKAFEDIGDYDAAWEHLVRGNTLKRAQIHYNEAYNLRFFERICTVFDAKSMHFAQGSGDPATLPVFVLGMPRSGSTLVEQILASHPQIRAAGENKHLEKLTAAWNGYPECVPSTSHADLLELGRNYISSLPPAAPGVVRIVDKLPGNFRNIGLIRMILPNARILHTTRDPLDVCVSCYSKLFAAGLDFTYDLGELGRYYRGYRDVMAHWRKILPADAILDVAYEDVVGDLEGQARRMIEFCGLAWDDRCLAFHQTDRTVRTASAAQVRQPLFRGSVERWRRYERHLFPFRSEL